MPSNYYTSTLAEKMGPEQVSVGWPWRFFVFSLLVALAVVAIYVGLAFGYKIFLQNRVQSLDNDIESLASAIPQEQQEKMLQFYSQLANVQTLLNQHRGGSAVFNLIERNTNQQVVFSSLELKSGEHRLALEGTAASYQIFAQQLEAFNRIPEVEKVIVHESYAAEGRVVFRLSLVVRDSALRPL